MFKGELGEKIFKMFLIDNNVLFEEDHTNYTKADYFDFILPNSLKIDVKTRTQHFRTRTNLRILYISVRLYPEQFCGSMLGWFSKEDILRIKRIENNGYLDNYVFYDGELLPIEDLFDNYLLNLIK